MEHRADGFNAVIDKNTGKVFSIVSRDYRLIRHEDAIEEVERSLSRHSDLGGFITSTAFYNAGARMRRTYRFPNVELDITKGDVINLELHLYNSYDMTWPFIVTLGGFRVVCLNGLIVQENYYHFKRRHVFDLVKVKLLENFSASIKKFKIQAVRWSQWAETPLTEKVYVNVMKSMRLGKNAVSEIRQQARIENYAFVNGIPVVSLWVFFNLITWHITHRAISLNHRVEMEYRLRGAMRYFRI